MKTPGKKILQGVVGSQAYGLANADSDYDRKGVYVSPPFALLSLDPPRDTVVQTDPDYEFHEVGKFCRLALKCNPTVLEQLFLEDYEILTPEGRILIHNRSAFLSARCVRGAFGGYAMDQIKRLQRRGDGSFSSDTRKRREKHARHCFRLLHQGAELLRTGRLTLKVADPEYLFTVGRLGDNELIAEFGRANDNFQAAAAESDLPELPDRARVNEVLYFIRSYE